ncbi:hypothetical protein NBRC10513v2_000321 [Rhodotorula toruloides]
MDELRCNSLRCRKSLALEGSAVVTTCSHIFCVDCANALFSVPQICPACETALPDADDVVQTALNPHDSYKTSILSGLSPSVILDIASRALNFYTYQVQQEAAFQALITKNAQERIAVLEAQCNTIMREAHAEINLLKERLAGTEKDLELERRRVHELQETHKANAKAYQKLKTQYDKTKQRSLLNPQTAPLAGDQSFANALASPALSSRQVPGTPRQTFVPAHASNNAGFGIQRSSSRASVSSRVGGSRPAGGQAGWSGSTGQQGRMSTSFGGGGLQQQEQARRPLGEQRTNVQSRGSGGSGGSGGVGGFAKAPHHTHDGEGGMQFLGQQQQQSGGMGGGRSGGGFTGFNRNTGFRPAQPASRANSG